MDSDNFFLLLTTLLVLTSHTHSVQGASYQLPDHSLIGTDNWSDANYKFEYGVDDESTGQKFGHEELRNGPQTNGRYSVLLPDGRYMTVKYTANEKGYFADVSFTTPSKNDSYENMKTAATSYGSPLPPPAAKKEISENYDTDDTSFGMRTKPRNFVKFIKVAYMPRVDCLGVMMPLCANGHNGNYLMRAMLVCSAWLQPQLAHEEMRGEEMM